jgi:hypothetical protein
MLKKESGRDGSETMIVDSPTYCIIPRRSLLWVHRILSIATQHWKYPTAEISTHFVCHMHVSAKVQISSAYVYTFVHTRACSLRAAHIPLSAQ